MKNHRTICTTWFYRGRTRRGILYAFKEIKEIRRNRDKSDKIKGNQKKFLAKARQWKTTFLDTFLICYLQLTEEILSQLC